LISISGLIKGNLSVLRKVNILELRKVKVSVTELLDKKAKNAIIGNKNGVRLHKFTFLLVKSKGRG
jgi:hypothetical protein